MVEPKMTVMSDSPVVSITLDCKTCERSAAVPIGDVEFEVLDQPFEEMGSLRYRVLLHAECGICGGEMIKKVILVDNDPGTLEI